MRILSRTIFREIFVSALLGIVLITFLLFLSGAGKLFEFLVRNAGAWKQLAYLFSLLFPQSLPFAIPAGTLVGTLLTLSRMSADGEITAMRAAGVPGRSVAPPILTFGLLATLVAAACSLWLTPWSIRERFRVQNDLIASQLTAEIQPRVFEEQFPDRIIYVNDVLTGATTRWRRIFMADITPPEKRAAADSARGDAPLVWLAADSVSVPDLEQNRIQLTMRNFYSYTPGKDPNDYRISASSSSDQVLQAQRRSEVRTSKPSTELDSIPLYRRAYKTKDLAKNDRVEAAIELQQRLALPFACILLPFAAISLGITTRRSGKSSAIVLTVAIALAYYVGLITGIKLAQQGTLPAGIALWIPNAVFTLLGIVAMVRLEIAGDRDFIGRTVNAVRRLFAPQESKPKVARISVFDRVRPRAWRTRFPQVIDSYILVRFVYYFVVSLLSFVMIMHVFTFFELLSDIIRNRIGVDVILQYHLFLTPRLIYDFSPFAALVGVLMVFGVLAKFNEVTAFKACGVSTYRLTIPVLVAATFLSAGLFAFDHYWVPEADRRQDGLRAVIKGRPPQTFLRPDRKWIYGLHDRIYNYRYFDQNELVMSGVNVYEIDPARYRLTRQITAERARWEPGLKKWVFQNGWSRDMAGTTWKTFDVFNGDTRTFDELEEQPDYFVKEALQSYQMNFIELANYIGELQQSGFDTVPLQVQYQKKFSKPLFVLIMAMVSAPFAFLAGNRGTMAGFGISLLVAIPYWAVGQVFEQMGNLGQLPAAVAAWSPDAVFALAGLYFLARMRT